MSRPEEQAMESQQPFNYLEIEKYWLGTLEPKRKAELEIRLAQDEVFRDRIQKMKSEVSDFTRHAIPQAWKTPAVVAKTQNDKTIFVRFWKPMAAAAILLLSFFPISNYYSAQQNTVGEHELKAKNGLVAKGVQKPTEVELWVNQTPLQAGGSIQNVQVGDTLHIRYRSAETVLAELRYKDDGGEWNSYFTESSDSKSKGLELSGSTDWDWASFAVVLESGWKKESLVLTVKSKVTGAQILQSKFEIQLK